MKLFYFSCVSVLLVNFLVTSLPLHSTKEVKENFPEDEKETNNGTAFPVCNCSVGRSAYCTPEGTCSSEKVAKQLMQKLAKAKQMMQILGEFPGDRPRREMRDKVCSKIAQTDEVVDLLLLDFYEWQPGCGRFFRDEEEIHTCTLVLPSTEKYGQILQEPLNQKLCNFYEYLGCPKSQHTYSMSDFHFCSQSDFCNSDPLPSFEEEELVEILPSEPAQAVVLSRTEAPLENFNFSLKQILLYFVAPAVLLLLLLIVVVVLIYSKPGAWRYVFPVAKVAEKNDLAPPEAAATKE